MAKNPQQPTMPETSADLCEVVSKEQPADDRLTQSERFIKAAQELETDDDPERFAERVRRLARQKPSSATPGESK